MSDGELLLGATYVLSLVAALLALPATLLLLRLYRRSILRLMNLRGSEEEDASPFGTSAIRVRNLGGAATISVVDSGVRRNVIVVVVVTLLSAVGYALLLLMPNDIDVTLFGLAYFTIIFSWPGVIGIWIVTAGRRNWVLASALAYTLALMTVGLAGGGDVVETFGPWVAALLPTVAVIAFLARPFRGVGPIVLGTAMVGILGAQVLSGVVLGSERLRDMWIDFTLAAGLNDAVTVLGLPLAGFLGACVLAWLAAKRLAAWYSRGGFSDQMLVLGSVFLVFSIDQSLAGGPTNPATFAMGMGIFVATGAGSLLVFRLMPLSARRPTNLLLLRVFSSDRSHQKVLDRVTARWRHLGAVRLIGAPDLAVATVDPDEFLAFVGRKLRRLFIDTAAALESRLAALQARRDPDGRYRVDEFFCFDNTWRQTVARLLSQSDAVLMDLRGLVAANAGALAEIRMLAEGGNLGQTVLLVDSSTDRTLLDAELSHLLAASAPTIVEVSGGGIPDRVVRACLDAAASAGFRDAA